MHGNMNVMIYKVTEYSIAQTANRL